MQLNELQLCYVAALADGLRLINEKAQERRIDLKKFDADALVQYVRVKGDHLAALHFGINGRIEAVLGEDDIGDPSAPEAVSFRAPRLRRPGGGTNGGFQNPKKAIKAARLIRKGKDSSTIARQMKCSREFVMRVRATLPPQYCECGRIATHRGWCSARPHPSKKNWSVYIPRVITEETRRKLRNRPRNAQFKDHPQPSCAVKIMLDHHPNGLETAI